jgi:8-amino-7-oxononanoate synthase
MRASRASVIKSFEHNDPESLKKVLLELLQNDFGVAKGEKTVFVAIESVYSMDGDIAPAAEIVQVVKECLPLKNAVMVVDEAHSNGIMGPRGSGFICHHGLESEFAIRLHTFGKGINATGGQSIFFRSISSSTLMICSRGPLPTVVQRDSGELRT